MPTLYATLEEEAMPKAYKLVLNALRLNRFGYRAGSPLLHKDPLGLVKWRGWARSIALGPYQREVYTLTSECACGLEMRINVTVNYGGPGLGAIAQGWYAELTDPLPCPSSQALDGQAIATSVAIAGRYGVSYSRTRIGMAESSGFDVIEGLGATAGVAIGQSSVEVVSVNKCDNCGKKGN
jgi:hypothetical protein